MKRAWWVAVVLSGCATVIPPQAREANDLCAQLITGGDLPNAEAACDHALEYQPKYGDALSNKALIAQTRGDTAAAKKLYIEALRVNNDQLQAHNALGVLSRDEGDLKAAIEHFKAALHVEPRFLPARRNLGAAHLAQKDWVEAEKDFRQFLLIEQSIVEGWLGLGLAFHNQKKFEEAEGAFEKATLLDVNDASAWHLRAANAVQLGNIELVKDCVERCLLADPKKIECQQLSAQISR
ncbi:MAG: tetratricopeptide repeat protein [Myxococcaceae bacterium]